ncbi:hypothetical protein GCM10008994_14990 [Halorubrum ejinorense]|uniref:Uncharacterized protein n=1 Tax=Halorubrum ejinorense TaxID=425309 RepID=A0AAV3SSF6_9EURY
MSTYGTASSRRFLGGSALTLAALTGAIAAETAARVADRPRDLDVDISAPFADAFFPVPAGDALSTTYALVIAERVDADTQEDLSYRAQSVAERLDIDVDELAATVAITPSEGGTQLVTAAGRFDRPDLGETIAVGERDAESNDDLPDEVETTDDLPAGWQLTETDEAALFTDEGVAAAATDGGYSPTPRGRSD